MKTITVTVECHVNVEVTDEEYNNFNRKYPVIEKPITKEERGSLEELMKKQQPKPYFVSYTSIKNFMLDE